jgi:hypothetical protein
LIIWGIKTFKKKFKLVKVSDLEKISTEKKENPEK